MSRRDLEEKYRELSSCTHFDFDEIEMLNELFDLLKSKKGPGIGTIERVAFRDMLMTSFKMSDDQMMDRIVLGLSESEEFDSKIKFDEFIKGMSIFLRGDLEEQQAFGFRVYVCFEKDKNISREEAHQLLHKTIVTSPSEEDTEEMIRDMIEILMKKMDFDKDHRIGPEDFRKATLEDKLLLQVFGPYLPQKKDADIFVSEKTIAIYRAKYAGQ